MIVFAVLINTSENDFQQSETISDLRLLNLKHEGALYKEVFPGKIEAHLSVTFKVRESNSKWRAI